MNGAGSRWRIFEVNDLVALEAKPIEDTSQQVITDLNSLGDGLAYQIGLAQQAFGFGCFHGMQFRENPIKEIRSRELLMNIADAAYHAVHDYPGGSESLGPRVDISASVLRSKVNPNNSTHHLTLAEAQRIAGVTGDNRMLQAWAHTCGFLLVKAPEGAAECDMSVLEAVVETGVAHGQWMQAIHSALADGKVDDVEVAAIVQAKRALQTAAATTTARIKGLVG